MKRGVWQAGGFPAELPAMAVSETFMKPSSMLYRNFLAMQVEEMLRSHPCDGAVLMGGCDKTTPGVLMGALSMDIPIIFVPGEHRRLPSSHTFLMRSFSPARLARRLSSPVRVHTVLLCVAGRQRLRGIGR